MANETTANTNLDRMKSEAVRRMKALRIMPNVIDEFKNLGIVNYSERQNQLFDGILYWVSNVPEYEKLVADFEKKHNVIVYHCQLVHTREMGDMLSLLYVDSDESNWERDFNDLQHGYAYAYVANIDEPAFSDFGTIGIKPKNGGITRTA